MAKLVLPRVHVMVLCDDIGPSSVEEDVFDLRGVRTHISAPVFPYTHPQLCVYLQMTGHEGMATGQVVIMDPETEGPVVASSEDVFEFRGPLAFLHVPWELFDCSFPQPGVYYVQVFFDGKLVGERPLLLFQGEAVNTNGRQSS